MGVDAPAEDRGSRLTGHEPSSQLVYFVDASMRGVGKAMAMLRRDVVYPGYGAAADIEPDSPDPVWLPKVGSRGWVLLLRDRRIRTRPGERQALLEAGVRTFCLTASGNKSSWDIITLLTKNWTEIERIAHEIQGPYIYSVTTNGVRVLSLTT
jgi:hypothetical protein